MSVREQLIQDINELPDDALNVVREFVLSEIKRSGSNHEVTESREESYEERYGESYEERFNRGYERFMKYKGTLKRDIDYKKELAEARDEKYKEYLH